CRRTAAARRRLARSRAARMPPAESRDGETKENRSATSCAYKLSPDPRTLKLPNVRHECTAQQLHFSATAGNDSRLNFRREVTRARRRRIVYRLSRLSVAAFSDGFLTLERQDFAGKGVMFIFGKGVRFISGLYECAETKLTPFFCITRPMRVRRNKT